MASATMSATRSLLSALRWRWLPFAAVLVMEWRQTWRSWTFRVAMLLLAALAIGYVLHRAAIYHQAGIVQSASSILAELCQASLIIGPTLMILLSAGTIAGERGTLADSVLSRGISRYAYFFGKWLGRLAALLGGLLLLGLIVWFLAYVLLRHEDLSFLGTLWALALLLSVLAAIATIGVFFSAVCPSTALALMLAWVIVHGAGALLWLTRLTPIHPQGLWKWFPFLIWGQYDTWAVFRALAWAWLVASFAALLAVVHFSRCDL
ncbi:MAG: ABC transporter permease [Gemmatales bacterium]|nr:ABC transporter permease [Gemmatales bacterium]MDW7994583.1 ABC transporter permease [Gemmatales bacterium]